MQATCGDAAAVLGVGEEEPGDIMKTIHGRRRPIPMEEARWSACDVLAR
jgi:hypothetical protein